MKVKYFFLTVVFFCVSHFCVAQHEIIGMLFDVNDKPVKRHPVSLGRQSPVTVKTDKYGIFVLPDVNLNDTLFVGNKRGKKQIEIPVNGYPFLAIKSLRGNFKTDFYHVAPEQIVIHQIEQQAENDRRRNSDQLSSSDIEKSGCRDVRCLLTRFSGVTVDREELVFIRGSSTSSFVGESNALIVIDGIVVDGISDLDIDDIENISVIRDASKYGVRGANGAIEIIIKR